MADNSSNPELVGVNGNCLQVAGEDGKSDPQINGENSKMSLAEENQELAEEQDILQPEDALAFEEEDTMPSPPAANPTGFHPFSCDGVDVLFPYVPYESQKLMMEHMIKGMNSGKNCLLESPTGTGKTAALLCASLAWLIKKIYEGPHNSGLKVIYACRTHRKLQQVVDQLTKTPYKNAPMVIVASRKQTCINESCSNDSRDKSSDKVDEMCDAMRANHIDPRGREYPEKSGNFPTCPFFSRFQQRNNPRFQNYLISRNGQPEPWDIEDLMTYGKTHVTCPYYEIEEMKRTAKLVLCTYNHLLHPWIRTAMKIQVRENIVIFDDAHNIDNHCMDIASRKISMKNLQSKIIPALNEAQGRADIPGQKQEPLRNVQESFTKLLMWLRGQGSEENSSKIFEQLGDVRVRKVMDPLTEFSAIGFSPDQVQTLCEHVKILKDDFENRFLYNTEIAKFKIDSNAMNSINSILFAFLLLFQRDPITNEYLNLEHYSVDVLTKPGSNLRSCETELSFICLSPSVIFKSMKHAHTIVVASGTMSPAESFSSELGMDFQHVLSAPFVLGQDKIFAAIIRQQRYDQSCSSSTFNYRALDSQNALLEQAKALGDRLLQLCQKIEKGVLIFFPSEFITRRLQTAWNTDGTLERLSCLKRIFFEHEITRAEFKDRINEYRACAIGKGAIMFAFFRGRISEGLDFAGDEARAVITVGIPFAPLNDLKIRRKINYNDDMRKNHRGSELTLGWHWYLLNAFRALNQGLSRCVRHEDNWIVIFMTDLECLNYRSSTNQYIRLGDGFIYRGN